jgi:hypothetical protein
MMHENDPMVTVRLAERSLRGFVLGLLGWIPLFGLPLAGLGIWIGLRVRTESRATWNPGKNYALGGMLLSLWSVVFQIGFVLTTELQQTYFQWVFAQ